MALGAIATAASLAALTAAADVASQDGFVATRPILARTVVTETDLRRAPTAPFGAATDLDAVVGMEARVTIYAGRPILPGDLRAPALVERNETVRLIFSRGGLAISTEGRALDRGGIGDPVRVMNISSRTVVSGVVNGERRVEVRR
ncbi:MAG: flagellar basal body P-ring formation chaperone FlgA [Pseudomonadota bacterium]